MRYNADDRGQRYCDIFPEIKRGDINVTVIESGASALWHRHKNQADYQLVVKGALKIGVCNMPNTDCEIDEDKEDLINQWIHEYYDIYSDRLGKFKAGKAGLAEYREEIITPEPFKKQEERCDWFYLSERNANNGPLYIPTGLWHGCHNYTNEPAILIYHITTKWDGTDEDRCPPEVMNWPYERVVK